MFVMHFPRDEGRGERLRGRRKKITILSNGQTPANAKEYNMDGQTDVGSAAEALRGEVVDSRGQIIARFLQGVSSPLLLLLPAAAGTMANNLVTAVVVSAIFYIRTFVSALKDIYVSKSEVSERRRCLWPCGSLVGWLTDWLAG